MESFSLQVDVWENLTPPSIDFADVFDGLTLCYLDSAPDFTFVEAALGGGGPLVYEWESAIGLSNSYLPTGEDSLLLYNPGALSDTTLVRLRVTDLAGCVRVSNALR